MVVITVKYDGETYVSAPQYGEEGDDNSVKAWIDWFKRLDDNLNFPLKDGGMVLLKSEVIKRVVFLVEEVEESL